MKKCPLLDRKPTKFPLENRILFPLPPTTNPSCTSSSKFSFGGHPASPVYLSVNSALHIPKDVGSPPLPRIGGAFEAERFSSYVLVQSSNFRFGDWGGGFFLFCLCFLGGVFFFFSLGVFFWGWFLGFGGVGVGFGVVVVCFFFFLWFFFFFLVGPPLTLESPQIIRHAVPDRNPPGVQR